MIQLEPGEKFIITRQIDDPADVTTYYVRAYVRNAESDVLLATVNLTDKGDQRFRGEYFVPADPSGLGFYITITTKVFTNSGYTVESTTYGREEDQFLVMQRWTRALGGLGGGPGSIRPSDIRKAIAEEFRKFKLPEAKNITKTITKNIQDKSVTDFSPVIVEIGKVLDAIANIKFPQPEKVDLGPVHDALEKVQNLIMGIPPTDLQPVYDGHGEIKGAIQEVMNKLGEIENYNEENNAHKEIIKNVGEVIGKAKEKVPGKEKSKKRIFID